MDERMGGGLVPVLRRHPIRPVSVKHADRAPARGQAQGPRVRSTLPPVPTVRGCLHYSIQLPTFIWDAFRIPAKKGRDQLSLIAGLSAQEKRRKCLVEAGLHGLDHAEETIGLLVNAGGEEKLVGIARRAAQAEL